MNSRLTFGIKFTIEHPLQLRIKDETIGAQTVLIVYTVGK